MTVDVEVLVIGAGACGVAAAIAAHDRDMSVALVEKLDRPGGNSALSTGSVPAAGSRFQREAGIDDDADRFFRDLMSIAPETDDVALVKRLTEVSAETVEWLVDHVGAKLSLVTAYKHIGHSVPRLHAPVSRKGQDLVDDLLRAAETRGIPLAVGNSVSALLTEDGRVVGARTHANGTDAVIRAAKTILAVNGFGGNAELVRRFCPEIAGAQYFGAPGSTGEAITWGEALGADFANMEAYQGYAAVAYPHGSLLSWTTIEKGGVLIGSGRQAFRQRGDRLFRLRKDRPEAGRAGLCGFRPEDLRYCRGRGGIRRAVQPRRFQASDVGGRVGRRVAGARGKPCRGAEGLQRCGAGFWPPTVLGGVTSASRRCSRASSDAGSYPASFTRREDCGSIPMRACCARTDRRSPICSPAAGPRAGISGRSGALGYASGNGLLTAIALGRIAGLAAAAEIAAER